MNRVMRWSGLLCGLLTAVGCGGAESAPPAGEQETLALHAQALTTKTAASWATSAPMPYARMKYQASMLNSGLVLVTGGHEQNPGSYYPSTTTVLYNPYSNTWQYTGELVYPVSDYTIIKLSSGKVLISGGYQYIYMVSGAQVYDPETGGWSMAGSLSLRRMNHRATLLQSGKVLVTGGFVELPRSGPDPTYDDPKFGELYDPETNKWTRTAELDHGTRYSVPVLLYSGEVMLVSSYGGRVDFYNPATNTWRSGPNIPGNGASSATRLYSGEVLVVGSDKSTFIYSPYSDQWRAGPSTNGNAGQHTATLLYSGEVLIAAGGSTEVYNPSSNTWSPRPNIPQGYSRPNGLLLHTGQVLVMGADYDYNAQASIFTP